jgi:hypothetical protein
MEKTETNICCVPLRKLSHEIVDHCLFFSNPPMANSQKNIGNFLSPRHGIPRGYGRNVFFNIYIEYPRADEFELLLFSRK